MKARCFPWVDASRLRAIAEPAAEGPDSPRIVFGLVVVRVVPAGSRPRQCERLLAIAHCDKGPHTASRPDRTHSPRGDQPIYGREWRVVQKLMTGAVDRQKIGRHFR